MTLIVQISKQNYRTRLLCLQFYFNVYPNELSTSPAQRSQTSLESTILIITQAPMMPSGQTGTLHIQFPGIPALKNGSTAKKHNVFTQTNIILLVSVVTVTITTSPIINIYYVPGTQKTVSIIFVTTTCWMRYQQHVKNEVTTAQKGQVRCPSLHMFRNCRAGISKPGLLDPEDDDLSSMLSCQVKRLLVTWTQSKSCQTGRIGRRDFDKI